MFAFSLTLPKCPRKMWRDKRKPSERPPYFIPNIPITVNVVLLIGSTSSDRGKSDWVILFTCWNLRFGAALHSNALRLLLSLDATGSARALRQLPQLSTSHVLKTVFANVNNGNFLNWTHPQWIRTPLQVFGTFGYSTATLWREQHIRSVCGVNMNV